MLFEYPVYQADIGDKGFKVVSLGAEIQGKDAQGLVKVSPKIIDQAADEAIELLTNQEIRQKIVDHNFEVAKTNYSMDALRMQLQDLFTP
jgi:hypothetical protein